MLDLRLCYHLLKGRREVLQNHDGLGPRVFQLMLEFARRVEWNDDDHNATGAQNAKDCHRVLQYIGHHDGDARALVVAPAHTF